MAFIIKQNDRRPYLTGQIREADNVTPLNLSTATGLTLIMRKQGQATAKFKKACVITNAVQGEWSFAWAAADTDEAGLFDAELEIMWGTEPQTVPADSYYQITILDDLDPAAP
jgi:hypothetical protein